MTSHARRSATVAIERVNCRSVAACGSTLAEDLVLSPRKLLGVEIDVHAATEVEQAMAVNLETRLFAPRQQKPERRGPDVLPSHDPYAPELAARVLRRR
jgi:hypothetical protein